MCERGPCAGPSCEEVGGHIAEGHNTLRPPSLWVHHHQPPHARHAEPLHDRPQAVVGGADVHALRLGLLRSTAWHSAAGVSTTVGAPASAKRARLQGSLSPRGQLSSLQRRTREGLAEEIHSAATCAAQQHTHPTPTPAVLTPAASALLLPPPPGADVGQPGCGGGGATAVCGMARARACPTVTSSYCSRL